VGRKTAQSTPATQWDIYVDNKKQHKEKEKKEANKTKKNGFGASCRPMRMPREDVSKD
jgi:hypothetical protein